MGTYCTDADMVAVRANILGLGVADWEKQRTDAYEYINKLILVRWYRPAAIAMGLNPEVYPHTGDFPQGYQGAAFDPEKLDADQLKDAAVYKSLELAYMHLMKEGAESDGFERFMNTFSNEFSKALDLELSIGLKYDWDDDGETEDEFYVKSARRLYRS